MLKKQISYQTVFLIISSVLVTSCVVSKKKYEDLAVKKSSLEVEKAECASESDSLQLVKEELDQKVALLEEEVSELEADTTSLSNLYKELIDQYVTLAKQSDQDSKSLETQLQKVSKLVEELEKKDRALAQDQNKITRLNADLEEREKKMSELEQLLERKDQAVVALRKKIADALLSFNDGELTVEMKDGKVYISLQEQLLFKSGSYDIDQKGEQALQKLANAIKENKELTIYVEGHTDDVPYVGSGVIKDNWDLSVLRATSIVKIMTKNGVSPKQVIASGRGEHVPKVAGKTKEARQKNRRIEVIINPDLKELYNAINEYEQK